jgi:hypothetical protein
MYTYVCVQALGTRNLQRTSRFEPAYNYVCNSCGRLLLGTLAAQRDSSPTSVYLLVGIIIHLYTYVYIDFIERNSGRECQITLVYLYLQYAHIVT